MHVRSGISVLSGGFSLIYRRFHSYQLFVHPSANGRCWANSGHPHLTQRFWNPTVECIWRRRVLFSRNTPLLCHCFAGVARGGCLLRVTTHVPPCAGTFIRTLVRMGTPTPLTCTVCMLWPGVLLAHRFGVGLTAMSVVPCLPLYVLRVLLTSSACFPPSLISY